METGEAFASEIREVLQKGPGLPEEEKRDILEMPHIRTRITIDRHLWLEGWFGESGNDLTSMPSSHTVHQTIPSSLVTEM